MVAASSRHPLRLVFCGTPEFAVPTLQALLHAGHQVPLVLTQPDRPAGRGLAVRPGPVKQLAVECALHLLQPERLKTNDTLRSTLSDLRPDAIIVVAYGRLVPPWMLELPRLGCVNLHGSLLPKYRGAAPIQWAVAHGETETGVSTMKLDAGMDTGDVLLEQRVPIGPDTLASDLFPQLASLGAALVVETLEGLAAGTLTGRPQEQGAATLAPILTREDGQVDPAAQTASMIYNRWRGFSPWPGLYTRFRGRRFLLHRVRRAQGAIPPAGELLLGGSDLLVGTAENTGLILEEVQLEGKARMTGVEFARGFQLKPGERLG